MKKFFVNFTRKITIEGTMEIDARNTQDAIDRANRMAEGGKFGTVSWKLKGAAEPVLHAEASSDDQDEIIIDDAYPDE